MSFYTRLCTFKTDDNERLHGLLFTPSTRQTDLALLFVHGVAMNFYLPPLSVFGQELAARGFNSFVINTRGHDWISRAGNLTKFGGSLTSFSRIACQTSTLRWNFSGNKAIAASCWSGTAWARSNRLSTRVPVGAETLSASSPARRRGNFTRRGLRANRDFVG